MTDDKRGDLYEEARKQTFETLPAFLKKLMDDLKPLDPEEGYNQVPISMAAGAVAACWAMDRHERGGITGFLAGCVMWEFIRGWMNWTGPFKILKFENMLFPHYADAFEPVIDQDIWTWLQAEARKQLEDNSRAAEVVKAHWQSIADGKVPFGYRVALEPVK